jgi:hypothetical protein
MWQDLKPLYRFPILIMGMLSLVVGILAGLGRLGISVPQVALEQVPQHGVLMIPAFFGTVIGLERAVALGQRWAYMSPLLTGLAGIALLIGIPHLIPFALLAVGGLLFAMASLKVVRIQNAIQNWILLGGAIALLLGNIQLFGGLLVSDILYWWIAFLLLTIAGERLELSRLVVRDDKKRVWLAILCLIPLGGAVINIINPILGTTLFAIGMLGIGLWLLLFDIARRTVRMQGLTRFTAVCMLTGYAWLLLSAILFLGMVFGWGSIGRDSALHTFLIGFVFSMVIGHALIIFPAVTQLNIPYSPVFYLPLIFLQSSLIMRVVGGLSSNASLLSQGGLLNSIALAVFIVTLVGSIVRGQLVTRQTRSGTG